MALASVPHLIGTAVGFAMLLSAAGALIGALMNAAANARLLAIVLGGLVRFEERKCHPERERGTCGSGGA